MKINARYYTTDALVQIKNQIDQELKSRQPQASSTHHQEAKRAVVYGPESHGRGVTSTQLGIIARSRLRSELNYFFN